MDPEKADRSDFDRLERYLKALAYANRLELLSLLRRPRTLDEIHLTPGPSKAGGSPDRPISRQAVRAHLEQLEEAGLVRIRLGGRDGKRAQQEYVVDHARLYAVTDELRKLSTFEPEIELDLLATEELRAPRERTWAEGPKLVLVRGVEEGRAFPLKHGDLKAPRGWVVGRAPEAAVRLEYDPYVSGENAEVLKIGNEYRLLDLRNSRNGTFLNWHRLGVGAEVPLTGGDVIGVGRSVLLFRDR
ncbi:MAG: FHA domain-containing protein [Methanobacteriota archaeon]